MAVGIENLIAMQKNNALTVRLKLSGDREMFKAILVEDFTFSGTATWGGDTAGVTGGIAETISKITDISIQTAYQSTLAWTGSERPQVPLSMIVVALTPDDDVTAMCKPLMRLIYPASVGDSAVINTPPLGFAVNADRTAVTKGSISCAIGRWFMATGMVASDFNITYSKQQTKKDRPLYAMISLTLQAAVMPDASQVQQYFIEQGA